MNLPKLQISFDRRSFVYIVIAAATAISSELTEWIQEGRTPSDISAFEWIVLICAVIISAGIAYRAYHDQHLSRQTIPNP